MKIYNKHITHLEPNEVFVFTSNLQGFSGAGSAGYATFNEPGNVWRKYDYDKWPIGAKGKWNYKGQSEGYGEGDIGKSYAIPTVTHAGRKRSIPLLAIKRSIDKFRTFACEHPEYIFYVAQGVETGLNGYSVEEMADIWKGDWPDNVYFYDQFAKYL
jgi:hypothetical protein